MNTEELVNDLAIYLWGKELSGDARKNAEVIAPFVKRFAREELAKLKDKADGFPILGVAHIDQAIKLLS